MLVAVVQAAVVLSSTARHPVAVVQAAVGQSCEHFSTPLILAQQRRSRWALEALAALELLAFSATRAAMAGPRIL